MGYLLWFLTKLIGRGLRPFRSNPGDVDVQRCLLITYCGANNTGAEARTKIAIEQIRRSGRGKINMTAMAFNKKNMQRYITEDKDLQIVEPRQALFFFDIARLLLRSDMALLIEGSGFEKFFQHDALVFPLQLGPGSANRVSDDRLCCRHRQIEKSNIFFTQRVLKRVDLLMMRNEQSREQLIKWGVPGCNILTTADTAFCLPSAEKSPLQKSALAITLKPRNLSSASLIRNYSGGL